MREETLRLTQKLVKTWFKAATSCPHKKHIPCQGLTEHLCHQTRWAATLQLGVGGLGVHLVGTHAWCGYALLGEGGEVGEVWAHHWRLGVLKLLGLVTQGCLEICGCLLTFCKCLVLWLIWYWSWMYSLLIVCQIPVVNFSIKCFDPDLNYLIYEA